ICSNPIKWIKNAREEHQEGKLPEFPGGDVAKVDDCHGKKRNHHHSFATKPVNQRTRENRRSKTGYRVEGHQAGDSCQWEQQSLGSENCKERPNHGCAGSGDDEPQTHQPKLERITAKNGGNPVHRGLFLGRLDCEGCLTGKTSWNQERRVIVEVKVKRKWFFDAIILNQVWVDNCACLVELGRLTCVENRFVVWSPQGEQVNQF